MHFIIMLLFEVRLDLTSATALEVAIIAFPEVSNPAVIVVL